AEPAAIAAAAAVRLCDGDDSVEAAGASDLVVRAKILNGRAAAEERAALATATLRVKEARLGPDAPAVVPSLLNLSDTLIAQGEFAAATAAAERAVAVSEHALVRDE